MLSKIICIFVAIKNNKLIFKMKKFLFLAVAAMMATVNVSAQHEEGESTIQPRLGITLSNLTNYDGGKSKLNFTYGVEYERYITDKFSFAAGVLFTDQGTKFKNTTEETVLKMYYAAVPVTINYYVLPGLAVKAGLQPAFRVKSQIEQGGTKVDFDRYLHLLFNDDDVKINKFDLSIPIGLSYEISNITLDARYNFGVTKVFSGLDTAVRNQLFIVTLGYKL